MGDYKVVHFTRSGGQEIGSGTILDWFVSSVGPVGRETLCPNCRPDQLSNAGGVVSSCLDCFLAGGDLYRFQYSVSTFHFIAKARGGTCTLAPSDSNEVVVERAKFLLTNGFTDYNLFKNNCEDFAVYCKTGLLAVKGGLFGQSGQPISVVGGPLTAVASASLELIATYGPLATNGCAMLAGFGVYSFSRYMVERKRTCIMKVEAEDLMRGLATGSIQVIEADLRKSSKISDDTQVEDHTVTEDERVIFTDEHETQLNGEIGDGGTSKAIPRPSNKKKGKSLGGETVDKQIENSVAVINNQLEKEETCKGPSLSDVIDVLKELKNLGVLSAQGYRKAKVSFCDKVELRLAFMDEENIIDRMNFLNEIFGI